ncbi:MAG: hypothetical protein HQL96_00145 [Magnetococcales bacterium]|nr:hypothetical protein [Magnetococcales bacterium]
MAQSDAQTTAVITQVFNAARSGTLTDEVFLAVLKLLMEANNVTMAHELLSAWHAGRKKK